MKKFLIILLAVTALFGCEKVETLEQPENFSTTTQVNVEKIVTTTTQTVTEKTDIISSFPQSTAENSTTTTIRTDTVISTSVTTSPTEIQQVSAVQTTTSTASEPIQENFTTEPVQDISGMDDSGLIKVAQMLFETACDFQWKLTVGCPYEIDMDSTVQNGFGWTYYKITDSNVHSLADIEDLYYGVFSDRYPNEDLKILYLDFEGDVYALNGLREKNIYYSHSEIKNIQSRTDDEIVFTVENYFDGTDMNPEEPYSETDTFSIVTAGNKTRVGQFRLPY